MMAAIVGLTLLGVGLAWFAAAGVVAAVLQAEGRLVERRVVGLLRLAFAGTICALTGLTILIVSGP